MNKKLLEELHRKLDKPRPRPLMYIGRVNGKKCYVRKQGLSYFQLLEKYPRPFDLKRDLKPRHHLQPKHHLDAKRKEEHILGYCIAAAGIVVFVSVISFYLYSWFIL